MTLEQLRACRFHIRHPTKQGFEDMAAVKHFVSEIPDEYIRKMISAYYLSGLTWSEVCAFCCPYLLPDCCRIIVRRYLRTLGVE